MLPAVFAALFYHHPQALGYALSSSATSVPVFVTLNWNWKVCVISPVTSFVLVER